MRHEPRSVGARYDRRARKLVIDLNNGCTSLVPPELVRIVSMLTRLIQRSDRVAQDATEYEYEYRAAEYE